MAEHREQDGFQLAVGSFVSGEKLTLGSGVSEGSFYSRIDRPLPFVISIEQEWRRFVDRTLPKGLTAGQLKAARRVFYAGFVAGFIKEPTVEDLNSVMDEAEKFQKNMKTGKV